MPAIETFDWFKHQAWATLTDEMKQYLERQRQYLLTLRNEDERRRFVEHVMAELRTMRRR